MSARRNVPAELAPPREHAECEPDPMDSAPLVRRALEVVFGWPCSPTGRLLTPWTPEFHEFPHKRRRQQLAARARAMSADQVADLPLLEELAPCVS